MNFFLVSSNFDELAILVLLTIIAAPPAHSRNRGYMVYGRGPLHRFGPPPPFLPEADLADPVLEVRQQQGRLLQRSLVGSADGYPDKRTMFHLSPSLNPQIEESKVPTNSVSNNPAENEIKDPEQLLLVPGMKSMESPGENLLLNPKAVTPGSHRGIILAASPENPGPAAGPQFNVDVDFQVEMPSPPEGKTNSIPQADKSDGATTTTTTTVKPEFHQKTDGYNDALPMVSLLELLFPPNRFSGNRLLSQRSQPAAARCNGLNTCPSHPPPASGSNCRLQMPPVEINRAAELPKFGDLSDCCPVWICIYPDGLHYVHFDARQPKEITVTRSKSVFFTGQPEAEPFSVRTITTDTDVMNPLRIFMRRILGPALFMSRIAARTPSAEANNGPMSSLDSNGVGSFSIPSAAVAPSRPGHWIRMFSGPTVFVTSLTRASSNNNYDDHDDEGETPPKRFKMAQAIPPQENDRLPLFPARIF